MAIQSGHGATLAFGTTTTFSPGYTSLGGFEATRETLDTSGLATTGVRTKIGGDLYDLGEQTHSYLVDPATLATTEANSIDDILFVGGTGSAAPLGAETITLTLSGGASFAGSGYVTGFAIEEIATDQLIAASITTQYADWPTIAE